jgi:hypothetical protein
MEPGGFADLVGGNAVMGCVLATNSWDTGTWGLMAARCAGWPRRDHQGRNGADRRSGSAQASFDDRSFDVSGFENHAGRTFWAASACARSKGKGNNGIDGTEGAVSGTVVGTYLHGPMSPPLRPSPTLLVRGLAGRPAAPSVREDLKKDAAVLSERARHR